MQKRMQEIINKPFKYNKPTESSHGQGHFPTYGCQQFLQDKVARATPQPSLLWGQPHSPPITRILLSFVRIASAWNTKTGILLQPPVHMMHGWSLQPRQKALLIHKAKSQLLKPIAWLAAYKLPLLLKQEPWMSRGNPFIFHFQPCGLFKTNSIPDPGRSLDWFQPIRAPIPQWQGLLQGWAQPWLEPVSVRCHAVRPLRKQGFLSLL